MLSDGELLRRYVDDGSEAAFTELVQRHINVVYASALRRVGRNAHAADDVTQRVFTDLARKARSLQGRPSLGGWLYTGARFAAAEAVRSEQRRRVHEQEAHLMNELTLPPSIARNQVEPLLDEVMDLLDECDREAVLLHFFEGRSFAEVGTILSLSSDAARMRVNRALERLRIGFGRRGIASTGAALAGILSTQAAISAPAALALAVAGRALNEVAATGGVTAVGGVIQAAKWPSFLIAPGAAVVIALGSAIVVWHPKLEPTVAVIRDAPRSVAVYTPAGAGRAAAVIAPAPPSMVVEPGPANEFTRLTAEEKNLLAVLWAQRENSPPVPGLRLSVKVGAKAPNIGGVDRLVAKGWAELGGSKNSLSLTRTGAAFCTAHRAEIDAYVPSANLAQRGG